MSRPRQVRFDQQPQQKQNRSNLGQSFSVEKKIVQNSGKEKKEEDSC